MVALGVLTNCSRKSPSRTLKKYLSISSLRFEKKYALLSLLLLPGFLIFTTPASKTVAFRGHARTERRKLEKYYLVIITSYGGWSSWMIILHYLGKPKLRKEEIWSSCSFLMPSPGFEEIWSTWWKNGETVGRFMSLTTCGAEQSRPSVHLCSCSRHQLL